MGKDEVPLSLNERLRLAAAVSDVKQFEPRTCVVRRGQELHESTLLAYPVKAHTHYM